VFRIDHLLPASPRPALGPHVVSHHQKNTPRNKNRFATDDICCTLKQFIRIKNRVMFLAARAATSMQLRHGYRLSWLPLAIYDLRFVIGGQ
jgi:hypothetical protein